MIAVVPDLDIRRLKIGFTKNIPQRLERLRTACPTAILLALWDARRSSELLAHRLTPGRIGFSEVFHVGSVAAVMYAIDETIGTRVR